ncbi:unnamed protein product [Brugia timori]|uniref:Uncharacterized protein n=1 Tax=Brugia timori TaxID=42155 RepID=A0A0R3Q8U5_9BILA|nr:unnamed protein product [Brugia timori]
MQVPTTNNKHQVISLVYHSGHLIDIVSRPATELFAEYRSFLSNLLSPSFPNNNIPDKKFIILNII